jgi:hypothetical protein
MGRTVSIYDHESVGYLKSYSTAWLVLFLWIVLLILLLRDV